MSDLLEFALSLVQISELTLGTKTGQKNRWLAERYDAIVR